MSLTAEITAYLFLFVILLYTSNIYYIVLLCTDIWSFVDTKSWVKLKIYFGKSWTFYEQMDNGLEWIRQ